MVKAKVEIDGLSNRIIGAAIEVHKSLGPGLLESAYEQCLCSELQFQGIEYARQVALPVSYRQVTLDCGYRLDIVVEDSIILELKAVESLAPIHDAQLLTYLKLSDLKLGLLLNFNVPYMRNGIKRIVNGL
ncbi:MAG: GxxExxY protein [Chitinivibrionales bacterium]|nr:GxxExxY protein [Chitinivibrionales bacterium]